VVAKVAALSVEAIHPAKETTMTCWRWLAVAVLIGGLVGLALCDPARAEDKKEKSDSEIKAEVVKNLAAAAEMAQIGRDKQAPAPEALIAAASLLRKVDAWLTSQNLTLEKLDLPVQGGTGQPPADEKKGKKIDAPAEKEKSLKDQAAALFDEARDIGGPGVVAMIKAARAREYKFEFKKRGAIGGPKRVTRIVPGNGWHGYTIWFEANKPAVVAVRSNGFVRFRVRLPGTGEVMNTAAMSSSYSWFPRQRMAATVYVQGTGRNATYTVFTN
jgi:hypothetical protein